MSIAQDMSGRAVDPTLRLLANPALLQKRIDQLDAAQQKAQAVIDRVGPIEDIEQTRAQVEGELSKQKEATRQAHEECERLIAEAGESARSIVEKATQEANSLVSQEKDRAAKTEAAHAEALSRLATAKKESEYLDQREKALTADREALTARESDLDDRDSLLLQEKSKLATVREQINAVLG